jgi:hypothetical protein
MAKAKDPTRVAAGHKSKATKVEKYGKGGKKSAAKRTAKKR